MNQIEFQKILDELCQENSLPKIRVEITSNIIGADAYFDPDKYVIVVTENTTKKDLYHEFIHYCIRLIHVAQIVEESVCDYGAEGINLEKNDD